MPTDITEIIMVDVHSKPSKMIWKEVSHHISLLNFPPDMEIGSFNKVEKVTSKLPFPSNIKKRVSMKAIIQIMMVRKLTR